MSIDTTIDLGRPVSGDVVDLILDDHRRFEDLLRQLRSTASDRDAVRRAFAALHVAHAEAEERHVYPQLKKRRAVDAHEADHGEHEHAEGNEALLAVLECASTDTQKFDDAVEELTRLISHHLTEEELTILNPAREELGSEVLARLGEAFATERNQQIDADCGRTENVRRLVEEAREEGLIDEE
ncbi:hemerythrin domain-containing protein [Aeromicrobium erythreum]|uniref:Cation-binding protein n=1 Tax=Aeromicrobium erythreum TaxID=2041 RepID=A0A0U4CRD7_9ACTN|nr:hemerythrin domain-containing protein [Aeromicrobium erythreum]ALX03453.1 cation-binding protein [Aeromicrobium erythreum]